MNLFCRQCQELTACERIGGTSQYNCTECGSRNVVPWNQEPARPTRRAFLVAVGALVGAREEVVLSNQEPIGPDARAAYERELAELDVMIAWLRKEATR